VQQLAQFCAVATYIILHKTHVMFCKEEQEELGFHLCWPTFWEQWGQSLPLHFNTLTFFKTVLCFQVVGLFVTPKIDIYTRMTGLVGCLLISMGCVHTTRPCRMFHSSSCPPWTLGRWERNLPCSFCAFAMHILLLCKTHVVMFWKEEQEKQNLNSKFCC
jgi:hypothetical protein